MAVRTKSSRKWLQDHFSDLYVAKARKDGYRSRAVYKLIELQEQYQLVYPGDWIVDLGAAPGSWSQYLAQLVKGSGKVFALDRLFMDALTGVEFVQGDFTQEETLKQLLQCLDSRKVNGVVSDLAPNTTGIQRVDQLQSLSLVEEVIHFSHYILASEGFLLVKIFEGPGLDTMVLELRKVFKKVHMCKPKASRKQSIEVYVLAKGYKMG